MTLSLVAVVAIAQLRRVEEGRKVGVGCGRTDRGNWTRRISLSTTGISLSVLQTQHLHGSVLFPPTSLRFPELPRLTTQTNDLEDCRE